MSRPYFLFISIDGMTDPLGSAQVLPYLIHLADKGYRIGIVSCEKEENFKEQSQVIHAMTQKANIAWHYCFYQSGKPFYSQWRNYKALKQLALNEIKQHPKTVVHCRSYLPALIGLYAKQKHQASFIFDMRGFWADERIEGNIWKKSNPIEAYLYSFFKQKEKQLLNHADAIVSLTHKAKQIMSEWGIEHSLDKTTVIPCCADLQHFSKENIQSDKLLALKNSLPQLQHKFVLSYIGSLGTWYMAKEMLDFFKCLNAKTPSVFLIITKDDKELIFDLAKKAGIDANKLLVISSHREMMPYYISLSTASLFFIKPSFSKSASSPTKMGELLSMGVPIVTNTGVGDVDDIVRQTSCGVLVNEFTTAQYERAIDDLLLQLEHYKTNTTSTAMQYFSLQEGVDRYARIYEGLS